MQVSRALRANYCGIQGHFHHWRLIAELPNVAELTDTQLCIHFILYYFFVSLSTKKCLRLNQVNYPVGHTKKDNYGTILNKYCTLCTTLVYRCGLDGALRKPYILLCKVSVVRAHQARLQHSCSLLASTIAHCCCLLVPWLAAARSVALGARCQRDAAYQHFCHVFHLYSHLAWMLNGAFW